MAVNRCDLCPFYSAPENAPHSVSTESPVDIMNSNKQNNNKKCEAHATFVFGMCNFGRSSIQSAAVLFFCRTGEVIIQLVLLSMDNI